MKDIRDPLVLASIKPEQLIKYIEDRGWTLALTLNERAYIYRRYSSSYDYELIIPMSVNLRDYPFRIGDILRTLSKMEGSSPLDIFITLESL